MNEDNNAAEVEWNIERYVQLRQPFATYLVGSGLSSELSGLDGAWRYDCYTLNPQPKTIGPFNPSGSTKHQYLININHSISLH